MSDQLNEDSKLDCMLRSHYKNLELRESKLEALAAMAATAEKPTSKIARVRTRSSISLPWPWQVGFALAGSVLILVFAVLQFALPERLDNTELSQLVSKEIALNHNKGLLPEFNSTDYVALATAMDKLDFSPIQPNEIDVSGLQLIGARYCSIHGQLATQIKLVDSNGDLVTLYQTQLNQELSQLPEGSYQINGVSVQQWQEAGLFFGLAKSAL